MLTVEGLIEQLECFDPSVEVAISYDGVRVDSIDCVDQDEDNRAIIRPEDNQNC